MPLQNRVTPFGEIAALPGRGLLTGNRGVLHDVNKQIVRTAQSRRWIACTLNYRGIRRAVMSPNRWTELFFLDEAVSLSAGHRPCAECRREDYRRFRSIWESAHGAPAGADAMDAVLQTERRNRGKKRTYRAEISTLPDGAYVVLDGKAWLVLGRELLEWSDSEYRSRRERPRSAEVDVLTPPSTVAVIAAGYRPVLHPSAGI